MIVYQENHINITIYVHAGSSWYM